MNTYDVYRNAKGQTAAVQRGFSWVGLWLGPMWTAAEGLWLPTLAAIAAIIACAFALVWLQAAFEAGESARPLFSLLIVCLNLYIASAGNAWRVAKLRRKGYRKLRTLEAGSEHQALAASGPTQAGGGG